MAEQNPPSFLQAGSHPADGVRRWIATASKDYPGVHDAASFAVTQKATPGMGVTVAAGRALIAGSESAFQGSYFVEARSTTDLTIANAHATLARWDLVIARVRDAAYSGVTNAWELTVVQGTPSASPAEPSLASYPNCILLARVAVAANASSIVNANITDRRDTSNRLITSSTSSQVQTSTAAAVISTGPTINMRPNYLYEVTFNATVLGTVVGDIFYTEIRKANASGTLWHHQRYTVPASNAQDAWSATIYISDPTGGAIAPVWVMQRGAGSGTAGSMSGVANTWWVTPYGPA